MGYNVHDLLRKFIAYYTKKIKILKWIINYDLKLSSVFKNRIYKESTHFWEFTYIKKL